MSFEVIHCDCSSHASLTLESAVRMGLFSSEHDGQSKFSGLSGKYLPCQFLYDSKGSELFEKITELQEYYPTRSELQILKEHATSIADAVCGSEVKHVFHACIRGFFYSG